MGGGPLAIASLSGIATPSFPAIRSVSAIGSSWRASGSGGPLHAGTAASRSGSLTSASQSKRTLSGRLAS
jgi:hypothetical protein